MGLGFEQAVCSNIKFKPVYHSDVEKWTEDPRNNRSNWNFVRAGIRQLSPSDALNVAKVKPHVFIGLLPSESFSVAGEHRAIKEPPGKL